MILVGFDRGLLDEFDAEAIRSRIEDCSRPQRDCDLGVGVSNVCPIQYREAVRGCTLEDDLL